MNRGTKYRSEEKRGKTSAKRQGFANRKNPRFNKRVELRNIAA